MKNVLICSALTLAAAGGGLGLASGAGADSDEGLSARVVNASGEAVGRVRLSFEDGDTQVKVSVDLPPSMAGFHGFHIHSVGLCEAPFTSAGGHLSGAGQQHRDHDGDLPVLLVNRDGHASARFTTDRLSTTDLRDRDGSAVIIHALPDNYANIPTRYAAAGPDAATRATGDSGGRIACGVLR